MRKRLYIVALTTVALSGVALPVQAQVQRIRGTVVDEQGAAVAGATIEATIAALADADFAVRNTDQVWRTETNAAGEYIVAVPRAGKYVVTAAKAGIGSDRIAIAVQRTGLVTANFTLWKARTASASATVLNCGTGRPIGAFARSPLAVGAEPGLGRLLGWLEAVHLHTPGCGDPPATEVARWARGDLETLLRDVRELVWFLMKAEDGRPASPNQRVLSIYDRRLTLDELRRTFYGGQPLRANDLLRRAAVLHADIAMFVPGDVGRYPLVADGGPRGWRGRSMQWEVGRLLLDSIAPSTSTDAGALLWYRAVSAHLFREGNLAELPTHLTKARQVFPASADLLFDSAYLHQELSSPAIQASAQELRANDVSVAVASRAAELQRAERFLREGLKHAPTNVPARVRLGHTLGSLGRHKEAAAELRQALDADSDMATRYLAALFLGREEEALGRREEARRRYEQAAELYPDAQSPRIALSGLARQIGDRPTAQQLLKRLAEASHLNADDPWWRFYQPHDDDADALIAEMRQIGTIRTAPAAP